MQKFRTLVKNFYLLTTVILLLISKNTTPLIAQCNLPSLTYSNGVSLCNGNTTLFTITVTPPSGCKTADNNSGGVPVYKLFKNGVLEASGNTNNFSTVLGGNTSYTAQVLLEQDPTTLPTITCPCIGYTAMSNSVLSNNIPATPVNLTQTVCTGTTPSITVSRGVATAPIGDLRWYNASNNLLHVGQTYTTPVITATTIYNVSEKVGDCESPKNTVTLNPAAGNGMQPPTIATNPNTANICNGASVTMTASHGQATQTGIFTWYTSSTLTTPVYTGNIYTVNPTTSTTYYVTENQNGCITPATSQLITVSPLITPTVNANSTSICPNNTATLTATSGGANGTFEWYSDAGATNLLYTGNPFITPNLATNTTFYVREKLGNCMSATVSITIQTNVVTTLPSAIDPTICSGNTATLSVTNGTTGDVFRWYDALTGGNLLAVSNNFTTPILNTNTQYFVERANGNCTSSRKAVTITVNTSPTPPTASDLTICYNQKATLTATASGSMNWYSSVIGGTSIAAGGSYQTGNLTQNQTYYVEQTASNGCLSSRKAVIANVNPQVLAPSVASNQNVCFGTTTSISTTSSGTNGNSIKWYDVATGGSALQSNTIASSPTITYTTPNLFTDKTYYVAETNSLNSCESERKAIQVVVQAQLLAPQLPTTTQLCQFTQKIISANYHTSSPQTGTITWYETNTATLPLATGKDYNLPTTITNSAGTYNLFAEHSLNNCVSPRSQIIITVNPKPVAPTTTPTISICENSTINLTATSSGSNTFAWTGPNGFTSNLQNPTINNAKEPDHQGIYSVVATDNTTGCASIVGTTQVSIFPQPQSITLTNNSPICENQTLILQTNTVNGATYTWKFGTTILGTTTVATFSILNATPTNSGNYAVDMTIGTCASPSATTTALINPIPAKPILTGIHTYCEKEIVEIKSNTYNNANYQWTSTNGYTSSNQNVWIPNALPSNSDTYTLRVAQNGCVSLPETFVVTVYPLPTLPAGQNISSNSPICEGQTLNITAPTVTGIIYNWTGVSNFTSTTQNPTINTVNQSQHQGNYNLTIKNPTTGCVSNPYSLYVRINPTVTQLNVYNNSPICEGGNLELTASPIQDAVYSWTGANGFSSNLQKPIIPNANASHSGEYSVKVTTVGGCSSAVTAFTFAQVLALPNTYAGKDQTVEEGNEVTLQASGALQYLWSPATYLTDPAISNPKATLPIGNHSYFVTGYSGNNCTKTDTVVITIKERTSLGDKDKGIMSFVTPNGDGKNDAWIIDYLSNLTNYELSIIDQKGMELYNTREYKNDWNGTYKNEQLPDGTYYYIIKTDRKEYKGAIWLQRGN